MNQTEIAESVDYRHDQLESTLSKILKLFFRFTHWKKKLVRDITSGKFDQTPAPLPKSLTSNFRIVESELKSRKIWMIQPKENVSPQRILFLHGGAYVYNITQIHWQFIEQLLIKTRASVVVPEYPLAPQVKYQDVYSFIQIVYEQLFSEIPGREIIFMGDSAGAGLALGFTQYLRDEHKPLPYQLILISPWLDVTMSHKCIHAIEQKDFMLDVQGLRMAGEAYADPLDSRNFRVSPLYGDFHGLPGISLFTGSHDLLVCDSKELKNRMRTACLQLNYYEYPKMFHDWMLVTQLKESKQAINQISDLIGTA